MTWWLMPATILLFWARYLRRHDWVGTSVHIVVLVSSISAGFLLYQLAAATLRGKRKNPLPFASAWTDAAAYIRAAWIGGLAVIVYFLSYGAIDGIHPDFEPIDGQKSFVDADAGSSDIRRWVPRLARAIGYDLFADLREVDVSTRLQNWKGQQEDEINMVKRGRLRGANLRFADATRAFLVGADLARANLQGTYLYRANLRQADLTWADLRESFIYETDLQNASLKDADLRGADLSWSNLTGVNLTGARLDGANFEKAKLSKTILNGTSLAEVKGLTKQQIAGAVTDGRTVWPKYLYAAKSGNKPDRR
jgi:uncharacterized protein YjbI with pentapeptide repeats